MYFNPFLLLLGARAVLAKCRCTPTDSCWPSAAKWNSLNGTVHGALIANEPLAKPCYAGFGKNAAQCQEISKVYRDNSFLQASPIGFRYPVIDACAPVNASIAGIPVCDLGSASVYSINATKPSDVAAGIKFAKENNVRLVVKNTGHDVMARSQGYGSLSIWMKHMKPDLQFQGKYEPSSSCNLDWTGAAIIVGGGYIWEEVYAFVAKHDHIAVGGSSKTVGAVGGYIQGGGHGLASHDFGLAADQVLEFKVVLASGELVTASACENVDLFTALRGGGGGTFGVVVSATMKVHPTRPVLKHTLSVTAPNTSMSALIDAAASVLSNYPILSDAGYSGNGELNRFVGTPSSYTHKFGKMLSKNSSLSEIQEAKKVMKQVVDLLPLSGLSVRSTFEKFDTFQDYFNSDSHFITRLNYPSPIIISRFFDKRSLTNNHRNLTNMLQTIYPQSSSKSQAIASLTEFSLIGGGEVLKPKPHMAIQPAWRETYMFFDNIDVPPADNGIQGVREVRSYATAYKLKAVKDVAPGSGTYMNEANPYDLDWKKNFYGDQYNFLESVKQKYDPDGVFWCFRCVGSEGWEEITGPTLYGPLCETK